MLVRRRCSSYSVSTARRPGVEIVARSDGLDHGSRALRAPEPGEQRVELVLRGRRARLFGDEQAVHDVDRAEQEIERLGDQRLTPEPHGVELGLELVGEL
jgi:hypothetical protein